VTATRLVPRFGQYANHAKRSQCPKRGTETVSSIADWRWPRFARNDMLGIGDKPVAGPASLRRGRQYKQTQCATGKLGKEDVHG
jgi:hypothetical protein